MGAKRFECGEISAIYHGHRALIVKKSTMRSVGRSKFISAINLGDLSRLSRLDREEEYHALSRPLEVARAAMD